MFCLNFLLQQEIHQHMKENCVWQTVLWGYFHFWPVSQNPTMVSWSINNVGLRSQLLWHTTHHRTDTSL